MYKRPIRSDELYHVWGLKRGSQMDDHKYIARVEDGINKYGLPRYRYFYTREEYNAYRLGKQQAKEPIKQEAVAQKTVFQTEYKPPLASLTSTNQNKAGTPKTIDDYKIDKHNVDPNAEKYDNRITTKEAFDNMRQSGIYDMMKESYSQNEDVNEHFKDDESFEKFLRSELPEGGYGKKESIPDILQRIGYIDEKQDGMHPASFDDLKTLNSDVNDDVDMYCINHDNLFANESDGDNDVDNDGYPDSFDYEAYTTNCAYCTLAYDMRQRGYDVEASAIYFDNTNDESEIESWYEDGSFSDCSTNDVGLIEQEILKDNPEGARGQFCCYWPWGGGHSMVYEVVNGEVWIRDCQINQKYRLRDHPSQDYIADVPPPVYMRTDNLKLTDKALVGVKNR